MKKEVLLIFVVLFLLSSLSSVSADYLLCVEEENYRCMDDFHPIIQVVFNEPVRLSTYFLRNEDDQDVPLHLESKEDDNQTFYFRSDDPLIEFHRYWFRVTAIDDAGHVGGTTDNFYFMVDLGTTSITPIEPVSHFVQDMNFDIIVETNREAECRASGGEGSTTDFDDMSYTLNDASGENRFQIAFSRIAETPVKIVCRSEAEGIVSDSFPLVIDPIIDTDSPSMIEVDDTTIDPDYPETSPFPDKLHVKFSGQDATSGIYGFKYHVQDAAMGNARTIVVSESPYCESDDNDGSAECELDIEGLSLNNGITYDVRVLAIDFAGKESTVMSSDGVTVDSSVLDHCNDEIQNYGETDLDCGGTCREEGILCAEGRSCNEHTDCQSGYCDGGVCSDPPGHCIDGVIRARDGETGSLDGNIDCGGDCPGCPLGEGCISEDDCQYGLFCGEGICQSFEALCSDGEISSLSSESDVDCGGDCNLKCGHGQMCNSYSDCDSMPCIFGKCEDPGVFCHNGVIDGDETGTDCGGSCARCTEGAGCEEDSDCTSELYCNSNDVCAVPRCDDNRQNGDETDVDCGGSCGPCSPGKNCEYDSDCQGPIYICRSENNVCGEKDPECDDNILNGEESDIDCGGNCWKCTEGEQCREDSDCLSGLFCHPDNDGDEFGYCAEATCYDGFVNNKETDEDCGGENCKSYPHYLRCEGGDNCKVNTDCQSYLCSDGLCQETPATCSNDEKDGTESDVDCGGTTCGACANGKSCNSDSDCQSNICDSGLCVEDPCTNDVIDDGETDVDCGGICGPCEDGNYCEIDSDCISGECYNGRCHDEPVLAQCENGIFESGEADIDCGGDCPGCPEGKNCTSDSDCYTGLFCTNEVCSRPSCNDNRENGLETDIDCGGNCDQCGLNKRCNFDSDCSSGLHCDSSGTCQVIPATCSDGVKNNDETDVDCGGSCLACENQMECDSDSDCRSNFCNALGFCTSPTCSDEVQNGLETDVDCGGNTCKSYPHFQRCASGESCKVNTDCENYNCVDGISCAEEVPDTCSNEVIDGLETDVDCGGEECGACPDGLNCSVDSDCWSEICDPVTGNCIEESCSNGELNSGESDIDCGGPCKNCENGDDCNLDSDCMSGTCLDTGICGVLTIPPYCQNGDYNPDYGETDIDCGGECGRCDEGQNCSTGNDCKTGLYCDSDAGFCAKPTCSDGKRNGLETDVDCGGSCSGCGSGKNCNEDEDCQNGMICGSSDTCQVIPQTCSDGVKNQDESDVDCGGSCLKCQDGLNCTSDSDCANGFCNSTDMCATPSCDDGIQNGDETDVDCGGSCKSSPDFQRCDPGLSCLVNTDCHNYDCVDGTCRVELDESCSDGVKNNDETDVDCGGSCSPCSTGLNCSVDSDCVNNLCHDTLLKCLSDPCNDGIQNGDETDVDCGGNCGKCSSGDRCEDDSDCISGNCDPDENKCRAPLPTCDDGISNGFESDTDCGGPTCPGCDIGEDCLDSGDCISASCDPLGLTCIEMPDTCSDGVKNNDETDVDCGGSCEQCELDMDCTRDADCSSGLCDDSTNTCIALPETCTDEIKNNDESDIDCGGSCPACEVDSDCEEDSDCKTNNCMRDRCKRSDGSGYTNPEPEEDDPEDESGSSGRDSDRDNDGMTDRWEERNNLDPDDKPGSPWTWIIIILIILLLLGGGGYVVYWKRYEIMPYVDKWMTEFDQFLDDKGVRDFFRKANIEIPHYTPGSWLPKDPGRTGLDLDGNRMSDASQSMDAKSEVASQPQGAWGGFSDAMQNIGHGIGNALGLGKKDDLGLSNKTPGQNLLKNFRTKQSKKKRDDIFSSFSNDYGSNILDTSNDNSKDISKDDLKLSGSDKNSSAKTQGQKPFSGNASKNAMSSFDNNKSKVSDKSTEVKDKKPGSASETLKKNIQSIQIPAENMQKNMQKKDSENTQDTFLKQASQNNGFTDNSKNSQNKDRKDVFDMSGFDEDIKKEMEEEKKLQSKETDNPAEISSEDFTKMLKKDIAQKEQQTDKIKHVSEKDINGLFDDIGDMGTRPSASKADSSKKQISNKTQNRKKQSSQSSKGGRK
ncbi:MAG: hypothetical protein ACLFUO_00195 [Candidatus Woesearchaeota archaeon]